MIYDLIDLVLTEIWSDRGSIITNRRHSLTLEREKTERVKSWVNLPGRADGHNLQPGSIYFTALFATNVIMAHDEVVREEEGP